MLERYDVQTGRKIPLMCKSSNFQVYALLFKVWLHHKINKLKTNCSKTYHFNLRLLGSQMLWKLKHLVNNGKDLSGLHLNLGKETLSPSEDEYLSRQGWATHVAISALGMNIQRFLASPHLWILHIASPLGVFGKVPSCGTMFPTGGGADIPALPISVLPFLTDASRRAIRGRSK